MRVFYRDKNLTLKNDENQLIDLINDNLQDEKMKILAARVDNEIKSLDYPTNRGSEIELLDCTDKDGMRVYIRGICYIMCMAFNELYPDAKIIINYQLTNSMFCECLNMKIIQFQL